MERQKPTHSIRVRRRGEVERGRRRNSLRPRDGEAVGEPGERAGREEGMGDKEEWPFISPPKLIEATSA